MKYRVRNKDGELEFPSFGHVEHFWLMGFIEPEDEILEEGKTVWRKANTFPLLVKAERSGEKVWAGTWFLWTCLGVLGASASLWYFHEARLAKDALESQKDYAIAVLLAVVVSSVLIYVTNRAFQRRKPHHKFR